MIRVDLMFKQQRPNESYANKILRLLRARGSNGKGDMIMSEEQKQWLVDYNIIAVQQEDSKDYYLLFSTEEDAVAFKLRFGV